VQDTAPANITQNTAAGKMFRFEMPSDACVAASHGSKWVVGTPLKDLPVIKM
jgi:hypothetical protein